VSSSQPLASIIIPTRNSIRTIEICLRSLRNQSYKNIEIIIADGSSNDGTLETAKKYAARIITFSSKEERTVKKNVAAQEARGAYLYFADSDFELTPQVIEGCVEACEHSYDAIIIPERVAGSTGFWGKCRELDILMYEGDDNVESPRFFRRDVFFHSGGFDHSLIFGEENDLNVKVRALGYRVGRIKDFIYHHEGPLSSVILRKLYYGKTSTHYIKKRGKVALQQFSPIRVGWVKRKDLIKKRPLHVIGMLIEKLVQYYAAFLGLIISVI
jgi:glycosyltransferase involved in cell wall biosynthesis